MTLAEMLKGSPLQQQRMADEYSMARDLSRSRHGTIQDPAKASQYRPDVLPHLIRDESPAPIDMRGDYGLTDLLMGTMPMAGITAFHGSPHKFSKFDMSRIGTGEGAQAYGHGLYFAENPAVAREYKDKLASGQLHNPDGSVFDPFKHLKNRNVRATLQKTDGDIQRTIARANELIESIPNTQGAEYAKKDIAVLSQLQGLKRPESNLYKVDIPDDQIAKMLDWDKPLSEQGESVRKALGHTEQKMPKFTAKETGNPNPAWKYEAGGPAAPTKKEAIDLAESGWRDSEMIRGRQGEQLYRDLMRKHESGEDVSNYLQSKGIPGIKYLDQGSRPMKGFGRGQILSLYNKQPKGQTWLATADTGAVKEFKDYGEAEKWMTEQVQKKTSNFVLFDDQIPQILEINDKPFTQNLMR